MKLILIFLCVYEITDRVCEGESWSYQDEGKWPGRLCHAGGKVQSPIDIRHNDAIVDFKYEVISSGKLEYLGYSTVLVSGKNNGQTIQFTSDGPRIIHPVMSGGPLKFKYRLEQLHFHSMSEHAIDGKKYPLEIHLVHIRHDLTVFEALQRPDGLAIVAVFCDVMLEADEKETTELNEILNHTSRLLKRGNRSSGIILDLYKLIPRKRDSYYTYYGSLTSPTCNEAVIWIVYDNPIIISELQFKTFGDVDIGSNFRSLQPLKDHRVYKPYVSNFKTPVIIEMYNNFVSYFKNLYSNVTSIYNKYYG